MFFGFVEIDQRLSGYRMRCSCAASKKRVLSGMTLRDTESYIGKLYTHLLQTDMTDLELNPFLITVAG